MCVCVCEVRGGGGGLRGCVCFGAAIDLHASDAKYEQHEQHDHHEQYEQYERAILDRSNTSNMTLRAASTWAVSLARSSAKPSLSLSKTSLILICQT